MRIAIVTEHYYPQLGGITEHVYGQATALARRGHEVTVVAPTLLGARRTVEDGAPRPEIFEVRRLGTAFPIYINGSEAVVEVGPLLASAFGRLYAERSFDVVHVHNPFGVTMPTIAIMRSKAPVTVATIHSVLPEAYKPLRLFRPLLEVLFGHLDAMVAVSPAVVDSIQPHFPRLGFEVIPNGVDTDFFSPEAEPLQQLRDGFRNILFVGRFDPRNGLKHMLRAFILLRERRDDVRLVVLGDGPLREVYRRMVPPELRRDVLFEGRVDRLRPRYLASADVLCTPCQLASFGMVLLEAMSAGVAVVASRNSGFQLLVEDGVQGLLIEPPKDEEQFAAALDHLLECPETARRMGAAGRERAVSKYDWPVIADQLEALYERLLTAAGPRRKAAATLVRSVGDYSTWLACGLVAVALVTAGVSLDRLLHAHFVLLLAFAAIAAAYLVGTFGATMPLFGRVVRAHPEDGRFALTFDDGPDPRFTPMISRLLAERSHRATFFVLGAHARKYPRVLEQLLADGHELANHGYDHRLLAFSGPAALRRQVQETEEAIFAATQRQPVRLFRAPHGVRSPWLGTTLRRLGYRVCGWTGSSFDTAQPGVHTIAARSCRRLRGGSILLLHDGDGSGRAGTRSQTVEALPAILNEAERRGLRSVRLSSLVEGAGD